MLETHKRLSELKVRPQSWSGWLPPAGWLVVKCVVCLQSVWKERCTGERLNFTAFPHRSMSLDPVFFILFINCFSTGWWVHVSSAYLAEMHQAGIFTDYSDLFCIMWLQHDECIVVVFHMKQWKCPPESQKLRSRSRQRIALWFGCEGKMEHEADWWTDWLTDIVWRGSTRWSYRPNDPYFNPGWSIKAAAIQTI